MIEIIKFISFNVFLLYQIIENNPAAKITHAAAKRHII